MLVQENYDQRAQLLTKGLDLGCIRQVCHLLLKELFRFGNQFFFIVIELQDDETWPLKQLNI